jgi:Family of unknown function (DUF6152)
MRHTLRLSLTTSIAVLALSAFAFAHHGNAAYDSAKMTTVTGIVTDFKFTNPHVLIAMDVKDPSTGKIEKWEGELTSPNHLARAGWTRSTIKPGDELTMTGAALKSGAPAMAIRKIVRNGEQIPTGGGDN